MKIDVFTTCYNEEIILPYFIKHYKQFARNIFVYDNMSDDSSVDIIKNSGVNLIQFDTKNKFEESALINLRNNCWKNSDADWVIVVDMDELVYHPNIVDILKNTSATLIHPKAYEMMSESLPTTENQIYDEIKMGYSTDEFPSMGIYPGWKSNYSKGCVFKPSELQEINFGPGSHECNPVGNVSVHKNTGIKLLHYKYINREVLIKKYQHYKIRQSEEMIKRGWGNYQGWDSVEINKQYDSWLPICENVID
jgi:glycosyltransferase involved in cell wall biosynthesis